MPKAVATLKDVVALLRGNDEARKHTAWAAARPVPPFGLVPPPIGNYRYDCDGRLIRWEEYGQYTRHGWHIDHAVPLGAGGTDFLHNLRARHWYGNCSAGGSLANILAQYSP